MIERKIGISPKREFITFSIFALFFIWIGISGSTSSISQVHTCENQPHGEPYIMCVVGNGLGLPIFFGLLVLGIWSAFGAIKAYRKYSKQQEE
jgi:hypothetical protein